MTNIEFDKMFTELTGTENIQGYLATQSKKLLKSGAINLEQYGSNDFGIVKTVLSTCLLSLAAQYEPPSRLYTKEYKNLKHF